MSAGSSTTNETDRQPSAAIITVALTGFGEADKALPITFDPTLEIWTIKAVCAAETQQDVSLMCVIIDGKLLGQDGTTLREYGVCENDVLCVVHKDFVQLKRSSSTLKSQQLNDPASVKSTPSKEDTETSTAPQSLQTSRSLTIEDAFEFCAEMQREKRKLSVLIERNPALAEAVKTGDIDFVFNHLSQVQKQVLEKRRLKSSSSNTSTDSKQPPADSTAREQKEDRYDRLDSIFEDSLAQIPELSCRVAPVYIACRVNGFHVMAFIDTGSESSMLQWAMVERCGLSDVFDERWKGTASGSGEQPIIGRVHSCKQHVQEYDEYTEWRRKILQLHACGAILARLSTHALRTNATYLHRFREIGVSFCATRYSSEATNNCFGLYAHAVNIQIGSDFYYMAAGVVANQPMELTIGLDFLVRNECIIDLKRRHLVLGDTGHQVPLAPEAELPEHARGRLSTVAQFVTQYKEQSTTKVSSEKMPLSAVASSGASKSSAEPTSRGSVSGSSRTPVAAAVSRPESAANSLIERAISGGRHQSSPSLVSEADVDMLTEMGFERNNARQVLSASNGHLETAVALLLERAAQATAASNEPSTSRASSSLGGSVTSDHPVNVRKSGDSATKSGASTSSTHSSQTIVDKPKTKNSQQLDEEGSSLGASSSSSASAAKKK